jgi:hypothetical protein
MTVPTIDHVAHTTVLLRVLARDADPDYHLVARIIDRLAWLDGEIREAERARSLPGASNIHVLAGANNGVEANTYDPLLIELRRLRRTWRRDLRQLEDGFTCTACSVRFSSGWERDVDEVASLADQHTMSG